MKALILKDIYNIRIALIILFLIFTILYVAWVFESLVFILYMLGLLSFVLMVIICQQIFITDNNVNWNNYLISMPIKREAMVNEKFLLLSIIIGFIFIIHIVFLDIMLLRADEVFDFYIRISIYFEIAILILTCAVSTSEFVNHLLSNNRREYLFEKIFIVVGIILIGLLGQFLISDNLKGTNLSIYNINMVYIVAFLSILLGVACSYIYCHKRINEREY